MALNEETVVESFAGPDGFDFWVGEWDGDVGGGLMGVNIVTRDHARRVIKERFSAPQLRGESVSVFNEARRLWCQTWVDDSGSYLLFVGRREADRMVLDGRRPDGAPNGMRMVWDRITPDAFEWDYQRREADGSWSSQWHISYVRRQERAASGLLAELQNKLDDYVAAWHAGDSSAILGHLAPDAVLLPHDGLTPLIGRDAARAFWFGGRWPSGGIGSFKFALIDAESRGEDSAIAWGTRELEYWQIESGEKVTYGFRGTVLLVFARSGTSWTISHFMWDDPPPTRTLSALGEP